MTAKCFACEAEKSFSNIGNKDGFNLIRCSNCASVTVSPFPTNEELDEYYQSYKGSTDYRAKKDSKVKRSKRRIKSLMKRTKGRDFLDVGCNYGFAVMAARDLGLNAKGIDVDSVAVNSCKQEIDDRCFEHIAIEDYASSGAKADIIYSTEVIEHVSNPDGFIKAIAQTLNKGGVLYITTPDAGHFRVPSDFSKWRSVRPPEHINFFTKKGIKILLEKHGLELVKFAFNLKPGIKLVAKKC